MAAVSLRVERVAGCSLAIWVLRLWSGSLWGAGFKDVKLVHSAITRYAITYRVIEWAIAIRNKIHSYQRGNIWLHHDPTSSLVFLHTIVNVSRMAECCENMRGIFWRNTWGPVSILGIGCLPDFMT